MSKGRVLVVWFGTEKCGLVRGGWYRRRNYLPLHGVFAVWRQEHTARAFWSRRWADHMCLMGTLRYSS
jgi:hypothetical protein